ncbi:MAG: hypothetical protein V4614_14865 [Pseudomonadota bacterium]
MFINSNGEFYIGDMRPGDRAATAQEVTAHDLSLSRRWHTDLMVELRSKRDKLLDVMDGIQSDCLSAGDTETALAIKGIKQGFKDVPALAAVLQAADEPTFRVAVLAAYKAIANPAPMVVKLAMAEYLK